GAVVGNSGDIRYLQRSVTVSAGGAIGGLRTAGCSAAFSCRVSGCWTCARAYGAGRGRAARARIDSGRGGGTVAPNLSGDLDLFTDVGSELVKVSGQRVSRPRLAGQSVDA